jgi:hypothetical protein
MDNLHIIISDVIEIKKTGEVVRLVFGYDLESNPVYLTLPVVYGCEEPPKQTAERADGCPF